MRAKFPKFSPLPALLACLSLLSFFSFPCRARADDSSVIRRGTLLQSAAPSIMDKSVMSQSSNAGGVNINDFGDRINKLSRENTALSAILADLLAYLKDISIRNLPGAPGTITPQMPKTFKHPHLNALYSGGRIKNMEGEETTFAAESVYSSADAGVDIGAQYALSGLVGLGVSVKIELTNGTRQAGNDIHGLWKAHDAPTQLYCAETNYKNLVAPTNCVRSRATKDRTDETKREELIKLVGIIRANQTVLGSKIIEVDKSLKQFSKAKTTLEKHLVAAYRLPIISLLGGWRHVYNGGDIWSGGLAFSNLFVLGPDTGSPGVTVLLVVQEVALKPQSGESESHMRGGLSLIWQDRTSFMAGDKATISPWQWRFGVEYIPKDQFSSTDGRAGFVRWRDLKTYFEVTGTMGRDSGGRNYAELSLGKTFSF